MHKVQRTKSVGVRRGNYDMRHGVLLRRKRESRGAFSPVWGFWAASIGYGWQQMPCVWFDGFTDMLPVVFGLDALAACASTCSVRCGALHDFEASHAHCGLGRAFLHQKVDWKVEAKEGAWLRSTRSCPLHSFHHRPCNCCPRCCRLASSHQLSCRILLCLSSLRARCRICLEAAVEL